ncbi:hypothetical protein [Ciceribacter sp. L1K22]|uniref:hypothetical protein n=1 Tax=Ciceribacter sp. L1K22 TaxID=2820275 RepID=UPI001ABDFF4E|nr:hypothetical protein [Ciceribacter sp. L1K22]MBO3760648.1 hypothetical protein [Ciceribacter sp. L1K22]
MSSPRSSRRLLFVSLGLAMLTATPSISLADGADPLRPVKAVMGVTIRSSGGETTGGDVSTSYFDPEALMALYSVGFTRDLAAALVKVKSNEDMMFLDHEPVIGGQDNCEVTDVTYEVGKPEGDKTPVFVEFNAFACFGEEWAKVRTRVVFDVVQEGYNEPAPWYYVDDIRHLGDDGKTDHSLREQFRALAED